MNPDPPQAPASSPPGWRDLLDQRRYGASRHAYLLAGGDDPGIRTALAALADVEELVHERSFAKAIERLRRLEGPLALVPWAELMAQLELLASAATQLDKRDPDAAAELIQGLDESTWFPAEYHTQLGTIAIYDSRLEEARAEFEKAVTIDPKHYRALTNLGNVALEQGQVDAAIEHYQAALALNDEFSNAHHNLGVAYRRKGHISKSVRSLRRAQRTHQKHEAAVARESLGKLTGQAGAKYLKYALWAAAAVGVYLILKATGYL